MGNEYYTTNSQISTKSLLKEGEQFSIAPGQFALLLTKEIIKIPRKNLGFISIKAGIKFQGLINVSGFHVDPGYEGRLKFSVYNAGSKTIVLQEGQRLFPLWLGEFNQELSIQDAYDGKHQDQKTISGDDVSRIAGTVISSSVLNEQQKELVRRVADFETSTIGSYNSNIANARLFFTAISGVIITFMGFILTKYTFSDPNRALQNDVDRNQIVIEKRFQKQDSALNAQKIMLLKQDSIIRRFKTSSSGPAVVDKNG
ncbi:MAG: hypothetical protein EOO61_02410 [Hymenobacter sp.]|nr:MAG: hypothetical protein EOO61_02410 [Hymenobacter sp.]